MICNLSLLYALQQQKIPPLSQKQPDDFRFVTVNIHVSRTFFSVVRIGFRPFNYFSPDADSQQSTKL